MANKNGGRLPISFSRLSTCVANSKFNFKKLQIDTSISEVNAQKNIAVLALTTAIEKDKKSKADSREDQTKITDLKSKIDEAEAKADIEATSVYLLALLLWSFGLFVEVFIIGFEVLFQIP